MKEIELTEEDKRYLVRERSEADIEKYGSVQSAIEALTKELRESESLWSKYSCDSLCHEIACNRLKIKYLTNKIIKAMNKQRVMNLLFKVYNAGFSHGATEGHFPEHGVFEAFNRLMKDKSPLEDGVSYIIKDEFERLVKTIES